MSDRKPPIVEDTDERAILGCLISEPSATIAEIGAELHPKLFGSHTCQIILRHALALLNRGDPLNQRTMTESLVSANELDRIGGAYELIRLETFYKAQPSELRHCLEKIREQAAKREALNRFARLTELCESKLTGADAVLQEITRSREAIAELLTGAKARQPMLEFLTPSQLCAFEPPPGWNIVGDYHIQRTSPFVIGGPPGTGKSRALTFLAAAGATGQPFFGLPVHQRFKTMILQCENGRVRIKGELAALGPDVDAFIRYSPPPPFGFAFSDPRFLEQLRAAVESFRPDVFALDPWNRLARDDRGKDYKEAFEAILSALPPGDDCPAIGIVAHTRKPQAGERANGRALLNLLAGSYVLGSVPRSAFILQPASDDENDDRVVWSCAKNNDGTMGAPSAWFRRNGLFAPCLDFSWEEFDAKTGDDARSIVTEDHMKQVFENGKAALSLSEAKKRLEKITGFKKTACYTALKPGGRFHGRLTEKGDLLRWK